MTAWRLDVGEEAYALLVLPLDVNCVAMPARLTAAEREVARLIVAGLSNSQIAERRGTAARTVANQAASIFRKLGVRSRLGVCARIAQEGAAPRVTFTARLRNFRRTPPERGRTHVQFDVIRAVEACYARADDDHGWLSGLLESLRRDDDGRLLGHIARLENGTIAFERAASLGPVEASEFDSFYRFQSALSPEALRAMYAPSPPVGYTTERGERFSLELALEIRSDPDEALQLWQGLVEGTWSLVDHYDSDGKRYILARRNEPGVRDPRALTQRERSVAAFAAMGHQNKLIGYMLGRSAGTVAGHLRAAQRKLGLASRAELIRCFAPLLGMTGRAATSSMPAGRE